MNASDLAYRPPNTESHIEESATADDPGRAVRLAGVLLLAGGLVGVITQAVQTVARSWRSGEWFLPPWQSIAWAVSSRSSKFMDGRISATENPKNLG
jgi:hypothetical protein